MPRIAKPRTADASAAARALHDYMRHKGYSGNMLAVATDVSQSTISRFLSGRTKTVTKAILPVLSYAGIEPDQCIAPTPDPDDNSSNNIVFARLVQEQPHLAKLLATLVEAMLPALQSDRPPAPRDLRQ